MSGTATLSQKVPRVTGPITDRCRARLPVRADRPAVPVHVDADAERVLPDRARGEQRVEQGLAGAADLHLRARCS